MKQEIRFTRQDLIGALRCEAVAQGWDVPPASECGVRFQMRTNDKEFQAFLTWEGQCIRPS
jgi:hypothetical protein